jgi:uncharacterized protein YtpQ (UPF0354 family)
MDPRWARLAFAFSLLSQCRPQNQAAPAASTQARLGASAPSSSPAAIAPAAHAGSLDLSSRESFTRSVAARITNRVSRAFVRILDEPLTLEVRIDGGDSLQVNLDRIWRFCAETSAGCDEEVGHLEGALRDSTANENLTPDMLVAVVRNQEYIDSIRKLDTPMITEPLVGDLVVLYMVDIGSRARGANDADLTKLGLTRVTGAKRARDNTARKLGAFSDRLKRGNDPMGCLARGQFYESSALLETDEWAHLAKANAPAVVSVPAADVLCFAWKSDERTLALLHKATDAMFKAAPRPLSTTLLKWTGTAWRPL